jgi:hypothetical protein
MTLVATMIAVVPRQTAAECVRLWKDIPDAKGRVALVFSGTVVERKPDPDGLFVTFAVDRVWKGPRLRRLVLPLYMTLDSFRFLEGEKYLVFADRHPAAPLDLLVKPGPTTTEPIYEVSQCSPTTAFGKAHAALAQLGSGSKPK